MAQSNFEKRIDTYEIESTNVMTGDRDRSRYLYYQLKMSIPDKPKSPKQLYYSVEREE